MQSNELSILEYFNQNKQEPAGASVISEKLNIPKDSVFITLKALENKGVLKYAGFEQSFESPTGAIVIEPQYRLTTNG